METRTSFGHAIYVELKLCPVVSPDEVVPLTRAVMMTRLVTVFAMMAGLASVALAQTAATTNMEICRQKVKADKKLGVAQNLQLTDAEGATFWPISASPR